MAAEQFQIDFLRLADEDYSLSDSFTTVSVCESEANVEDKAGAVKTGKYKFVINKKLLHEFLIDNSSNSRVNIMYLNELKKLIRTIFNRHFSKYFYMMQDLMGDAITAVFVKKSYYEPNRDAYNFLYAIIRNEIGNKILKYTKEHLIDSYAGFDNTPMKVDYFDDIPRTARKYVDELVGDIDANYAVVKDKDVLDLLIYLKMNERKGVLHHAPEYLELTQTSIDVLYELLRHNYNG